MRNLILIVLALLASTAPLEAQKNCSKGKPCGNTCIARNKTCHVGTGTARSAPARAESPANAASPAKATDVLVPRDAFFVASSRGRVYYATHCNAWRSLSAANLRWFPTAEAAEAAGYTPSTAPNCAPTAVRKPTETPEAAPPIPAGPPRMAAKCTVSTVYDGDTVTCRGGEKIRLLLIDTPEMDQGDFGREARRALLEIMPLGTELRVEQDVERQDRYGRTLGYLWLPDGRMVNEELARAGYALSLTYPPNVRHVDRIRAAVEEAKASRRGLWAGSGFSCEPRDHRAGRCE
jgi:micrococcal nuclease